MTCLSLNLCSSLDLSSSRALLDVQASSSSASSLADLDLCTPFASGLASILCIRPGKSDHEWCLISALWRCLARTLSRPPSCSDDQLIFSVPNTDALACNVRSTLYSTLLLALYICLYLTLLHPLLNFSQYPLAYFWQIASSFYYYDWSLHRWMGLADVETAQDSFEFNCS